MKSFTATSIGTAAATLLLGSLTSPGAAQTTVEIGGVADGDSRFFDFFSDGFSQLDQSFDPPDDIPDAGPIPAIDGYFRISSEVPFSNWGSSTPGDGFDFSGFSPSVFEQDLNPNLTGPQGTGFDTFPTEGDFDLGLLTYDDSALDSSGSGTVDITDYTVDFQFNMAFEDSPINALPPNGLGPGYDTTTTVLSGSTVTLVNNEITDIDLSTDIVFAYRLPIWVDVVPDENGEFGDPFLFEPVFPDYVGTELIAEFVGEFSIDAAGFDLFVDDTSQITLALTGDIFNPAPFRHIWDSTGSAFVIPEPGVGLVLAASSVVFLRRRRGA